MQHSELTYHELPEYVETSNLLQPYMQFINDEHSSNLLPETLIGDEMRLMQVMATLIKNALKYSKG